MVRWARAFLTERKATVRCDGSHSSLRDICEGFPQGTVLGPIFWDFFLDDIVPELRANLPPGVGIEVVLYADDISVVLRARALEPLYAAAQQAGVLRRDLPPAWLSHAVWGLINTARNRPTVLGLPAHTQSRSEGGCTAASLLRSSSAR